MFPIKWSDFFRKKDGNLVFMDEMGGGSVNWMSQSEWDALTFEEQKEEGFTAIGTPGTPGGRFYDFSDIEHPWYYDPENENVVNMLVEDGFNFHGFYSKTSGDRITCNGRGGTRASNELVFICSWSTGYFSAVMIAKSLDALAVTSPSYFGTRKIVDRDLYVGGNISGAWESFSDVSFTHDGVNQKLGTYYPRAEYLIDGVTAANNEFVVPSRFNMLLDSIEDFLNNG